MPMKVELFSSKMEDFLIMGSLAQEYIEIPSSQRWHSKEALFQALSLECGAGAGKMAPHVDL